MDQIQFYLQPMQLAGQEVTKKAGWLTGSGSDWFVKEKRKRKKEK